MMATDAGLIEMMNQAMTIESWVSQDQYGAPSYGSPFQVKAYIDRRSRMVLDWSGQAKLATAAIYVAVTSNDPNALPQVGAKDRITLPGGEKPVILSVQSMPDERGRPYCEVVYTTMMGGA